VLFWVHFAFAECRAHLWIYRAHLRICRALLGTFLSGVTSPCAQGYQVESLDSYLWICRAHLRIFRALLVKSVGLFWVNCTTPPCAQGSWVVSLDSYTAPHSNRLQRTATHLYTLLHTQLCITLQHTATHCNTLQHTAAHCNTLQHTAAHATGIPGAVTSWIHVNCNTLNTATHCTTPQLSQQCNAQQ